MHKGDLTSPRPFFPFPALIIATGVLVFCETNPVGYSHLLDLCRGPEALRIYLFKSGLLGDRTGVCESCKQGNVYLTKKEGSFHWKCGARACRKTSPLPRAHFLNDPS